MAHLWIRGTEGRRATAALRTSLPGAHAARRRRMSTRPDALLLLVNAGGATAWALIVSAKSGIRVNCCALAAGLRVLADRVTRFAWAPR